MIKKLFFILLGTSTIIFSQIDTSLTLTEIMFSPNSGNNEFIEIFNLSETQSIDLAGYKFKYSTSNPDAFVNAGFGTILPPRSYAVIFEGDYDLTSGIYAALVPPSALVLKISDNSFGTSGMANSENRPLWLLSPTNDTIDVYTYSANNSTGRSDEKKALIRDSSTTNWSNSLTNNGTPGFRNSVFLYEFDLQLNSLSFSPAILIQGSDVTITAKTKNIGLSSASNFSVEIYYDVNFDSVASPGELVSLQNYFNLPPNDSVSTIANINSLNAGEYQIIAKLIFSSDENPLNDKLIKRFTVFPPGNNYNDIVVNEIMYAPSTGEPEWVELYNRTNDPINLKKWRFSDAAATVTITSQDIFIQPKSFLVLTADSSILNFYNVQSPIVRLSLPALNNTGDAVVIKDSLGVIIDSVLYFPNWGGSIGGRSLERLLVNSPSNDSTNWKSSIGLVKATPGKINSITPKENDLSIARFFTSKPFSILGDSIEFNIQVKNIGLNSSSNFIVYLYLDLNADSIASLNELFASIPNSGLLVGDSITIKFWSNNFAAGPNHYIAILDVIPDDDSLNNKAFTKLTGVTINEVRGDLIINEFMFAPTSPEPEWIEVYNRSNKIIDLRNYKIADAVDTVKVISSSVILNPNEYLIISKDASISNFYNIPSRLVVGAIPTLNNTDDKIILLDSLNRVIDSLFYRSTWGGSTGKSLERIEPIFSSTDSASWKASVSIFKATPGYINSHTKKDFDIIASNIVFEPKFPLIGDNVSISAFIKNPGKSSATFDLMLFDDANLDSIPDILIEQINRITLSANDSVNVQFSHSILNLQSKKAFQIKIFFDQDQDTTNNKFYKSVEPGYPSQTIVVNEIMFAPAGGEPEWIELYNNSSYLINLKNWIISDVITTPLLVQIKDSIVIAPESFLVLAKDSTIFNYHRFIPSKVYKISLPSLNNDADGVVIRDQRGLTIDSVLYNSQWGGTNGFSLERISSLTQSNLQTNWLSSKDIEQSTPGRINSATPKQFDLLISGIRFEPRFPIAGEDISVIADIKNTGASIAENYSIEFYIDSDSNNVVDLLLSSVSATNLFSGDSISITSNTKILNLQSKILVGVKIIFAFDDDTLNNYFERSIQPGEARNIIKISEVMYNPADGDPEWIELVNVTNQSINIRNWSVSDVLTIPTKSFITSNDVLIDPNEYFVVAKDSSFLIKNPGFDAKFFTANFGTLGNTSDGVVIYDYRNGIIDSLFYRSSWGTKKGYSLERISIDGETNDSLNWTTSLSLNKSTPGKPNSLINIPNYSRNDLIINEIMFDPETNNAEYIEFINLKNDSINIGGWKFEDEKGNIYRLSDISFILPPNSYFIFASDSSIFSKFSLFGNPNINTANTSSLGLVNTGELIFLKDVKGNVIDSIWYSDKWHNKNITETKGKSLERINPLLNGNDPMNWSSSVNNMGGTPGEANSIFTENLNSQSTLNVSPNPFSPDNDGYEDFTIINYNLNQPVAQVRIKIFDSKGRLVRTLLNNSPSGSSGSIIFDGLDDDGQILRIGIYIIFLEAMNDNIGIVETVKSVVVVARKL